MAEIVERLKKIKYKILREKTGTFTDAQLIPKAQSIYDAAINADTPDMTGETLPTEALGIPLSWSVNNTTLTIDVGDLEIEADDLTDDVVPDLGDQLLPGAFQTNGEFFKVNNEIFEIRIA